MKTNLKMTVITLLITSVLVLGFLPLMSVTTAHDYEDAVRIDGNKFQREYRYEDGEWTYEQTFLEGWDIILKQEVDGEWVEINRTTTSGHTGYYSFIVRDLVNTEFMRS